MKRRLNVITLLLVLAFGLHIIGSLTEEWGDHKSSFLEGYEEGREKALANNLNDRNETFYLTLIPNDYSIMTDSVYNEKTQSWLPARTVQTVVSAPAKDQPFIKLIIIPCALFMLAAFILIVICFIKLIIAVNKSIIFEWVNVTRLRRMGLGFIVLFVINVLLGFYYYNLSVEALEIAGYHISKSDVFTATTLILGLASFLIAEIFSVGLRLKEEQDLTI